MTRLIGVLFAASLLAGCAQDRFICGKVFTSYGFLNESTHRNPHIQYQLVIGNLLWSVVLLETLIAPVYFVGFSLFEPVGLRTNHQPGVVASLPAARNCPMELTQ